MVQVRGRVREPVKRPYAAILPDEQNERRHDMKRWVSALTAILVLMAVGRAVAEDDLSLAASRVHSGISSVLQRVGRDMQSAAKETGKLGTGKESEMREILLRLCADRPYVIDAAFVDSKGVMKIIEPEQYRKHEGADISKQEAVMQIRKSKKPRMGKVFNSVEGAKSVDIEYPVFSGNRKFSGSVSLLVRQDELVHGVAAPLEKELGVNCWVMQKDGVIIYETDGTHLGSNLFHDPLYRNYPELISLGKRMTKEKNGTGFYPFPVHGSDKVVKKAAAWKTIQFLNNHWIVVAFREVK
jgi:hypothetical protein